MLLLPTCILSNWLPGSPSLVVPSFSRLTLDPSPHYDFFQSSLAWIGTLWILFPWSPWFFMDSMVHYWKPMVLMGSYEFPWFSLKTPGLFVEYVWDDWVNRCSGYIWVECIWILNPLVLSFPVHHLLPPWSVVESLLAMFQFFFAPWDDLINRPVFPSLDDVVPPRH